MYDGNDIANNDEEYMCGDTQALYYLDQPTLSINLSLISASIITIIH